MPTSAMPMLDAQQRISRQREAFVMHTRLLLNIHTAGSQRLDDFERRRKVRERIRQIQAMARRELCTDPRPAQGVTVEGK
jgi:hypothetical protein